MTKKLEPHRVQRPPPPPSSSPVTSPPRPPPPPPSSSSSSASQASSFGGSGGSGGSGGPPQRSLPPIPGLSPNMASPSRPHAKSQPPPRPVAPPLQFDRQNSNLSRDDSVKAHGKEKGKEKEKDVQLSIAETYNFSSLSASNSSSLSSSSSLSEEEKANDYPIAISEQKDLGISSSKIPTPNPFVEESTSSLPHKPSRPDPFTETRVDIFGIPLDTLCSTLYYLDKMRISAVTPRDFFSYTPKSKYHSELWKCEAQNKTIVSWIKTTILRQKSPEKCKQVLLKFISLLQLQSEWNNLNAAENIQQALKSQEIFDVTKALSINKKESKVLTIIHYPINIPDPEIPSIRSCINSLNAASLNISELSNKNTGQIHWPRLLPILPIISKFYQSPVFSVNHELPNEQLIREILRSPLFSDSLCEFIAKRKLHSWGKKGAPLSEVLDDLVKPELDLSDVPFFKPFFEEHFSVNQVIISENQQQQYIYIISQGNVNLLKGGVVLFKLTEGDWFGERGLFELPEKVSAVAQSQCKLFKIPVGLFWKLCDMSIIFKAKFTRFLAISLAKEQASAMIDTPKRFLRFNPQQELGKSGRKFYKFRLPLPVEDSNPLAVYSADLRTIRAYVAIRLVILATGIRISGPQFSFFIEYSTFNFVSSKVGKLKIMDKHKHLHFKHVDSGAFQLIHFLSNLQDPANNSFAPPETFLNYQDLRLVSKMAPPITIQTVLQANPKLYLCLIKDGRFTERFVTPKMDITLKASKGDWLGYLSFFSEELNPGFISKSNGNVTSTSSEGDRPVPSLSLSSLKEQNCEVFTLHKTLIDEMFYFAPQTHGRLMTSVVLCILKNGPSY